MSRDVDVVIEVYDDKTNLWIARPCNYLRNSNAVGFLFDNWGFTYYLKDIMNAEPYKLNKDDKCSDFSKTRIVLNFSDYDINYFTFDQFKNLFNNLTREFYCRNEYNKIIKVNKDIDYLNMLDDVSKELDLGNVDEAKKILATRDSSEFIPSSEIDESYEGLKCCIRDMATIYLDMIHLNLDRYFNMLVNDNDIIDAYLIRCSPLNDKFKDVFDNSQFSRMDGCVFEDWNEIQNLLNKFKFKEIKSDEWGCSIYQSEDYNTKLELWNPSYRYVSIPLDKSRIIIFKEK